MKKRSFITLLLVIISLAQTAQADIICLKNGNAIKGIVVQETGDIVKLEAFLGAKITFNKQDIAYVQIWDKQKNQALREKWLKEKKERQAAELARQEFEAEQRSKGLVKYGDRWVSKAEDDKLKTREYINKVLNQKVARGEIVAAGRRKRTNLARFLLAKVNWRNRQTEHFIIYYEDLMQSKRVADQAEYFYEKIIYDLNFEESVNWGEKCEVFIIASKKKWQEYLSGFIDVTNTVGGFIPGSGEKEIFLCALSLPYLSVTFPHELTHLIFREFAQSRYIPLWLDEGLAVYESGLIGYANEMLHQKVKEANHIPISKLVKLRDYPKDKHEMQLFYAQAETTVELLITQHGRQRFSRFCQILISEQSFDQALNTVYGDIYDDQKEFKGAWIRYVLR